MKHVGSIVIGLVKVAGGFGKFRNPAMWRGDGRCSAFASRRKFAKSVSSGIQMFAINTVARPIITVCHTIMYSRPDGKDEKKKKEKFH